MESKKVNPEPEEMEEGGEEQPALEQNPQQSLDQTFDLSVAASTAAEKRVAKDDDEEAEEDVAALKSEVQRLKEKLQVCALRFPKEWTLGSVNSFPRSQRESGGGIHAT